MPKAKPAKTKPKIKSKAETTKEVRKLRAPSYKTMRLSKRVKHPVRLPSAWKLFKASLKHIRIYWRPLGWIVLVYSVLTIALVKGLLGTNNLNEVKQSLEGVFSGAVGQIGTGFTIFAFLVSDSSSSQSESAAVYQSLLLIIFSLATIWTLRQTYAGEKPNKGAIFYRSQYPLIQFVLVLLVIGLQLIPFALANFLYSIVIGGGLAVTIIEKALWLLLLFLLALLSLYMIASSFFALYIVTLPDMTPMRALRSAREIVRFRRWTVLRKLLVLPVILLVGAGLIMLPLILFLTPIAEWIFFGLSMAGIIFVHSYGYALYRELL
jgi:hypothetical protein